MARRQTYSGNMLGRGRICATLATAYLQQSNPPIRLASANGFAADGKSATHTQIKTLC